MSILKEKALAAAISQIGQKEEPIGSNSGPMVNKYLASVGLGKGYAWCWAFVHWCFDEAGIEMKGINPVIKTGGVLDGWNRTKASMKLMAAEVKQRPELLEPGDQIVFKHGATTGHTGIVERVDGTVIHTIEGNTNEDGGREGYEVIRKVRNASDIHLLGVIRY